MKYFYIYYLLTKSKVKNYCSRPSLHQLHHTIHQLLIQSYSIQWKKTIWKQLHIFDYEVIQVRKINKVESITEC